jgi:sugar-specific transcriptional regulator TrmB
MKNIHQYLKSIGFSDNEINLYLNLLKLQSSNIAELSKITSIPRTTTSRSIEKLIKKGLISKSAHKSDLCLVAEEPQKIELLLRSREIELENKLTAVNNQKKLLNKFIKGLSKKLDISSNTDSVSIKYYEGRQSVINIYHSIITSTPKEIYTFLNINNYMKLIPEVHEKFKFFLYHNRDSKIYEILFGNKMTNQTKQAVKDIGNNCICKFGSSNLFFDNFDILIYENKFTIINLMPQEFTAIEITSKKISTAMIAIHKSLWNFLPNIY